MGLDLPNIRAIIHVDLPYTLENYTQETGRAGRDNKISEAYLLLPKSTSISPPDLTRPISEDSEKNAILRYISANCRRAILNSFIDEIEKKNCRDSVVPCDFCFPDYQSKLSK